MALGPDLSSEEMDPYVIKLVLSESKKSSKTLDEVDEE
jgi:hypothetical protein